jgi:hypothetical protein
LTAAITESRNTNHHALASRALVRARLRQWDTALVDAEQVLVALFLHTLSLTSVYTKAIKIQPSVIGYIAKGVALVSNGERHKAYRACDIAFERCHSSHVTFLLLVKVCIFRTWFPLSCSYPLGHHRIYGRRASRRHIPRRRPHRYGPLELNLLCSSGTCTRSTTLRTSPLTSPAGIYVSSPWKFAHGAQRLRGCNTVVRACTNPNTTPCESSTLGGLTGRFANDYTAAHRNDLRSLTDVWMEV